MKLVPPGADLVLKNLKKQVIEAIEDLVVSSNGQIWCIFCKKRLHFFYQTAGLGCFVREGVVNK